MLLANEDCELGDQTNPWAFALLKNWLRSAFVPVNRRFSVLQSVLQSCNARLSSYFKAHPELVVETTSDRRVKVLTFNAAAGSEFVDDDLSILWVLDSPSLDLLGVTSTFSSG